mmetsp:Transcript_13023/g.42432  ORF Transcript_13023/g.42432 Transcript_13023/m.42432 type:complete len:550 (-) Transcript_13023:123-1772(-)
MHDGGDVAEADVVLQGDGDLGEQVPGVGPDDRRPEDFIGPLPAAYLDEASSDALALAPVDILEVPDVGLIGFVDLLLVQADVGDFRIGVGRPRHQKLRIGFLRSEEGIPHGDPAHEVCGVGELVGGTDVPRRVDVGVRRRPVVVDVDPASRVVLDAGEVQPQVAHVRRPPRRVQDGLALEVAASPVFQSRRDDVLRPRRLVQRCFLLRRGRHRHLVEFDAAEDGDAVFEEGFLDECRGVVVFAREEVAMDFEDRHRAAAALEGLGEFDADGPRSDEAGPRRQFLEVEEVAVRQMRHFSEPGNRNDRRRRSRTHEALVERHSLGWCLFFVISSFSSRRKDFNGLLVDEPGLGDGDVFAEVAEIPLNAVVGSDGSAELAHAVHDFRKVDGDFPFGYGDAKVAGVAHFVSLPRAGDEAFARKAADVETVAPHVVLLDEQALLPEGLAHDHREQPRDAGPDGHDVVRFLELGQMLRTDVLDRRPHDFVRLRQHRVLRRDDGPRLVVAARQRNRRAPTGPKQRTQDLRDRRLTTLQGRDNTRRLRLNIIDAGVC